jgi:hypothetical protein
MSHGGSVISINDCLGSKLAGTQGSRDRHLINKCVHMAPCGMHCPKGTGHCQDRALRKSLHGECSRISQEGGLHEPCSPAAFMIRTRPGEATVSARARK